MSDIFTKFSRMVAADKEPVLTNDELEEILDGFATSDAAGNLPTDPEWVPTYHLRAAARAAWTRKAAIAAELQSTDLDGDRMSANQIFEHCERMVKRYAGSTSVLTGSIGQE